MDKIKRVMYSDERGVSPVIGVILLVAITVVLAAAIGAVVLVQSDSLSESSGSYVTDSDQSADTLTVEFMSVSNAKELVVFVDSQKVKTIEAPRAGDKIQLTGVDASSTVRFVEEGSGSSQTVVSVPVEGAVGTGSPTVTSYSADDSGSGTTGMSADLVVDKNDASNYDVIQNAVDNASSGDNIEIKGGTYMQTTTINKDVVLYSTEGAVLEGEQESKSGITITGSSTPTIKGITIQNYMSGITARSSQGAWVVENVTFEANKGYGAGPSDPKAAISASGSSGDWVVKDSTFNNNGNDGYAAGFQLMADGSTGDVVIKNTEFTNAVDRGIDFGSSEGEWVLTNSSISGTSGTFVIQTAGSTGVWEVSETDIGDNTAGTLVHGDSSSSGTAIHNWWGQNTGPESGDVDGDIPVDPYCTDSDCTGYSSP